MQGMDNFTVSALLCSQELAARYSSMDL